MRAGQLPGVGATTQAQSSVPALGNRSYDPPALLGARRDRIARRDTNHPSQDPTDAPEIKAGVEMLDQVEDVALGLAVDGCLNPLKSGDM